VHRRTSKAASLLEFSKLQDLEYPNAPSYLARVELQWWTIRRCLFPQKRLGRTRWSDVSGRCGSTLFCRNRASREHGTENAARRRRRVKLDCKLWRTSKTSNSSHVSIPATALLYPVALSTVVSSFGRCSQPFNELSDESTLAYPTARTSRHAPSAVQRSYIECFGLVATALLLPTAQVLKATDILQDFTLHRF
jgi:hypothetical protein